MRAQCALKKFQNPGPASLSADCALSGGLAPLAWVARGAALIQLAWRGIDRGKAPPPYRSCSVSAVDLSLSGFRRSRWSCAQRGSAQREHALIGSMSSRQVTPAHCAERHALRGALPGRERPSSRTLEARRLRASAFTSAEQQRPSISTIHSSSLPRKIEQTIDPCLPRQSAALRARSRTARSRAAEARLWSVLKSRQLGVQFRAEVPLAGRFIVDFFASSVGLIVVVDGGYHSRRRAADASRDR